MKRNQLVFILSTFLLSLAILIWFDFFSFSKVIYLPAWAKVLPFSIHTPAYIVFFCLIPVALFTDTITNASRLTLKSAFLSPVLGLIIYAFSGNFLSVGNAFLNTLFSYMFILLFHSLIPVVLLIMLRAAIIHFIPQRSK
jgi:hypothetical protein